MLTKLCIESPKKWYRHLPAVQAALNGCHHRAIGSSPFEVLLGVKMRGGADENIIGLLNEEAVEEFNTGREELREKARQQIIKIQNENRKQHNQHCKQSYKYQVGDLVFIKRTQFGTGLKIKPNFLGPYKVTQVNRNDRYRIEKVGDGEGPRQTASSADNMKLYSSIGTIDD